MGTRKKTLTADCVNCDKMEITDDSQLVCHWSSHKPKILDYPKGKRPRFCKLNRKGE